MNRPRLSSPQARNSFACAAIGIALTALVAAWTAQALSTSSAGAASTDSVNVTIGAKADYGGWGTVMMEADGNAAFCVQPQQPTPTAGTYETRDLNAPSGNDDFVRAMLYFGYGGPGFDASIWPRSWPLEGDTEMTQERLYALTHLTATYAWSGDMDSTLYRVWDHRVDWYYRNVFGVDGNGSIVNDDAPFQLISQRVDEVPSSFHVFEVATGKGSQTLVGWRIACDVTFTKTSADASISSGNASYALDGATYAIFRSDTDEQVATVTTDESGHAAYRLEPETSYYAVETQAPKGFTLDTTPIPFTTSGGSCEVALADAPQTVELLIRKNDSATGGEAQPGASLEGAVFEVTCNLDGTPVTSTVTTDENGAAQLEGLPLGTITVTETIAPTGYKLDDEPRTYTVEPGEQTVVVTELDAQDDFPEHVIAFDVEISKYVEKADEEGTGVKTPVEGVRFEILSNTTGEVVASIETNENGYASTSEASCVPEEAISADKTSDPERPWFGDGTRGKGIDGALPYDAAGYTVREVAETVPDGYERVGDWELSAEQIANGKTLQYIVNNHSLESRIRIVKTDAATGETVPLAGFSFQLLDADKNPIAQEVWYPNPVEQDTFTTDETGCVTLPERLEAGTYYLRETQAQPPYLVGDDLEFTVAEDGKVLETTTVAFADEQATGRIVIEKRDAGAGEAIGGATFDIRAAEDIVSPDGTIQVPKDETVASITTDENGRGIAENLPLGSGTARYTVVETEAPEGYVLDETPHEVNLSWEDDETPVVETHLELENSPIELTGEVDKRQEIATPTAPETFASPSEATPQPAGEGFSYSVDFRNTSPAWVEEFTVTDDLEAVRLGYATLDSIVTPQAGEDSDGTLDVWYMTNVTEVQRPAESEGHNDTRTETETEDGDETQTEDETESGNEAQTEDETESGNKAQTESNAEGDNAEEQARNDKPNSRTVDYTGWVLWATDVPADEATELLVDNLDLAEGEYVTGVRLEYGCVEEGFSSRDERWDDGTLKEEHDDVDNVEREHEGTFGEKETHRAPLILNLTVNDSYQGDVSLENRVYVDLSRAVRDTVLTDHDEDRVVQQPRTIIENLPQTGATLLGVSVAIVGGALGGIYMLRKKRHQ